MNNPRKEPKLGLVLSFDIMKQMSENHAEEIRGERTSLSKTFGLCLHCRHVSCVSYPERRSGIKGHDNSNHMRRTAHEL